MDKDIIEQMKENNNEASKIQQEACRLIGELEEAKASMYVNFCIGNKTGLPEVFQNAPHEMTAFEMIGDIIQALTNAGSKEEYIELPVPYNNMRVLKLDKNFHVYHHGLDSKIESRKDLKGKFLKLYYEELL